MNNTELELLKIIADMELIAENFGVEIGHEVSDFRFT